MRCREVRCWLYSFRPTASWPVDVVAHLQECQACQTLRTRLQRIDQGMSKLTGPVSDGTAQARLLDRIAETPQIARPEKATPKQPWPWVRYGVMLTGAAALIVIGFLLGHEPAVDPVPAPPIEVIKTVEVVREKVVPVEVIREKIVSINSTADRNLFAALLKHNAQLVQTSQTADRLNTLLDMAEDCRQQALALIEQGPRDSLPLTIDLYGQLLREGVLAQIAQAPAPARAPLQRTARARLDKMALPVAAPAALPKVVEDQRAALQSATQQARELVDRPEDAPARKATRTEMVSPAAALVQFAVAYGAEADPLARADVCADCVQRLMPSMMLCLAEDASPQRLEMGQQFGELIQYGIYAPLAVATAKEPPQTVKDQASRIYQNAAQTIAGMEEHLQQANENARPGLQRALDATKKGSEKSKGKGKGQAIRNIQGVFKSVDSVQSTITVTTSSQGKDAERTFALTKEILKLMGAQVGELKSGVQLRLILSEDGQRVIGIQPGKGGNSDDGQKNQK
jgi:hypothetical protein